MPEYVAAPHMTRFQCIGGACEDTCCKAWNVPISEADQARLATALGEAGALAMVSRIPNGRGGEVVVLRKAADRACTQLSEDHLCDLHRRLGEAVLPEICASYPRFVGRVGERLELTGRLSCPEVVRLSVLADEGAMIAAPQEPFGRVKVDLVHQKLPLAEERPYLAPFETVRDALVELCVTARFSVASRLYFIAELADRVAPFYHRESATHEPERLAHELAEIRRPDVQAELHARRGASSPMDGLALQAVMGLLAARLDSAPAFTRVVIAAARSHGDALGITGTDPLQLLSEIGPERLWRSHMARRAALGAAQTERLEGYLARYCKSYWLQDWYPLSPTLLEHALQLVLRVALVRFLLIAHPGFGPRADAATSDRAAVEVIYATSRAYDHNQAVRAGLSETLGRRGMLSVAHAAALLKL